MFGGKIVSQLAHTSLRASFTSYKYMPIYQSPKSGYQEIQMMLNRVSMVPNAMAIMNLRELLLKAKTESLSAFEAIESLLAGTTITDIIGTSNLIGARNKSLLPSFTFFYYLDTKSGATQNH